jgi:amidohydrolase
MNKEEVKRRVIKEIDRNRDVIIHIGKRIQEAPELGFKEEKTSKLVVEYFKKLGLEYETNLGITGVKARLKCEKNGPSVAVLGELDSVVCFEHPKADPVTGAAHACGHNAQVASMLGVAMGLVGAGIRNELAGNVFFFGVPAEEFIELSYRSRLRKDGVIRYLAGKPQLIFEGAFNDVDMAIMMHARVGDSKAGMAQSYNGCITKLIKYKGRPAHAGGAPDKGVNALYAALLGLTAINSIRETFKDGDSVRVHPIMIKGGDIVNVIPSDVRLETYVRGKTLEAIEDANLKVNQALKGGALALGAQVEIEDMSGYLPLTMNKGLTKVFEENLSELIGLENIVSFGHRAGSTDLGDLSHLMPVAELSVGGFSGTSHGADFEVSDPELAYVTSAKVLAMSVVELLYDDGNKAIKIKEEYSPRFTQQQYIEFMDSLFIKEDFGQLRD